MVGGFEQEERKFRYKLIERDISFMRPSPRSRWSAYVLDDKKRHQHWPVTVGRTFTSVNDAIEFLKERGWDLVTS